MYANHGKYIYINNTDNKVFGIDLLSSKGQNGGAVTFTDSGIIFGIYTGVEKNDMLVENIENVENDENVKNVAMCVRITDKIVDFVNGL